MFASSVFVVVLLLSAGLIAIALYLALLSRHRKAGAFETRLVGAIARAETELGPEGAVIVRGELWRARLRLAGPPVKRGQTVRITGASGHLLEVEPTE